MPDCDTRIKMQSFRDSSVGWIVAGVQRTEFRRLSGFCFRRLKERGKMYDRLTESDIRKMQEEIDYRKLVVRPKELEAVKEARAQGDLSENFEYKAAKQDKNRNESRIRYLEKMIKTARVISDASDEDEVGINNTVTVYVEEDDEEEVYKLVTSVRGNSLKGYVTIDSPLGKAIFHRKVGDRVTVRVSDSYSYDLIIRKIENTGDDGDELRSY